LSAFICNKIITFIQLGLPFRALDTVLIFNYHITNYQKLHSLKQYPFIKSHFLQSTSPGNGYILCSGSNKTRVKILTDVSLSRGSGKNLLLSLFRLLANFSSLQLQCQGSQFLANCQNCDYSCILEVTSILAHPSICSSLHLPSTYPSAKPAMEKASIFPSNLSCPFGCSSR
jgi:hypothetical protein